MAKTILIIDDDPDILITTSSMLKKRDFEVLEAKSAEEALELLKSQHPDLILTDVLLPEMTVQLNAHAKRENDTLWVFEFNQRVFSQVLTKEDWFFTITTRPILEPQ